jgi:hypothetical protein
LYIFFKIGMGQTSTQPFFPLGQVALHAFDLHTDKLTPTLTSNIYGIITIHGSYK